MQKTDEYLPLMTEILGVEKEQMRMWLCNRKIVTAQESLVKPLTMQQVTDIVYLFSLQCMFVVLCGQK